jgi:hypothetical protein
MNFGSKGLSFMKLRMKWKMKQQQLLFWVVKQEGVSVPCPANMLKQVAERP